MSDRRNLALSALVLFITSYAWMFSRVSVPNERTRAYLTMAIVDHGTIAIDDPLRRFGSVYDLAQYGGHYFTDKAPGTSLLAVPIYAFVRLWSAPNDWDIVELCNLFRTFLMLPFGLLGFVLLRRLLRGLSLSDAAIDLSSLAFSLGSPVLHYSGAFYGHVPVAVLVIAALYFHARAGLFGAQPSESSTRRLALLSAAAGACAGLAGLIEYQAIVLGAVLAVPICLATPRRRIAPALLAYGIGAAPFAAALLAYNTYAFGDPFELSYQHLVGSSLQELHGFGLAGATWPTPAALGEMAFSQHRGLFVTTPFLGFGLLALAFTFRRLGRALWTCLLLSSLYFVMIVASSSVWYGGWSFGLRLLIPIFGPLALVAAAGFEALARWPALQVLVRGAAILSVIYQLAAHATIAELPPEFERPLPDAIYPMLGAGVIAPNLGCKLVGLTPWSLAPLALAGVCVVGWLAACGTVGSLRARALAAGSSVVIAALAFTALSLVAPSQAPPEQERWLRLVQRWTSGETQCGMPTEK